MRKIQKRGMKSSTLINLCGKIMNIKDLSGGCRLISIVVRDAVRVWWPARRKIIFRPLEHWKYLEIEKCIGSALTATIKEMMKLPISFINRCCVSTVGMLRVRRCVLPLQRLTAVMDSISKPITDVWEPGIVPITVRI